MDPHSGFNSLTKTFHSLRPPLNLPQEDTPLSVTEYAFSLRTNSPLPDSVALISPVTAQRISYSDFIRKTNHLAGYLQKVTKLSKNDVAFVLSTNSIQLPILYFSLLSLGVIVSPANPVSTESEISRLVQLSKPVIAFATSSTAHKLPETLKHQAILIDSPEFESMTMSSKYSIDRVTVSQSDLAAIMFSSGTTGKVKGVMLTHRNLTAQVAIACSFWQQRESPAVMLYTMPYFHIFGFFYCLKSVALSEVVVVMERFDMMKMLKAVEEFRVTHTALTPPVVVAMSKGGLTDGYDLSSLEGVLCGAAPLGKDAIAAFTARFPKVGIVQGYGLTESSGSIFRTSGPEECKHWGSAGRISGGMEAKIVDPETGEALPPHRTGEIWLRGPAIMKGYIGDPGATSETLLKDGWMRTGDLCYIDEAGFLFVVDRLKELIKYKGYQVAPVELEQILLSHPDIADAAVVPYPDEESGQVPMAFVVRQLQNNLNQAQIMDFVAERVAPYKKIRRVAFVNSIPKNPSGKILRKELRKYMDMDPKSGFNSLTKTFHSLRPPVHFPPEDTPLSATEYAFSLRANSPWPNSVALINSLTGQRIFYSDFIRKTNSLAAYLQKVIKLSQNDVAFVLSPNFVQVPILYFSLLSLGVIVSPANPVSTESEISRLIQLSKPVIAFATSSTVHKLPRLKYQTVLIDSPEFDSVMTSSKHQLDPVRVSQSDLAAIMYSSGTTGRVKGVMLTHRNLISQVAISCGSRQQQQQRESPAVMLFTMPYFHIYGFYYCVRSVALSEVAVVMERSELKKMLRAVEEFKITHVALTPPVVVAISKDGLTEGYDLSSLEGVVCGSAPLGKDSIVAFMARFPKVVFVQAYGLTESTAGLSRTEGQEESKHWGSAGRLSWGLEAKIVDPETGYALPPVKHGELWIRGPIVMKGYIGDVKATGETLLKDGWMRTGDLCYIDEDGFLFVVDRLKELIKFKGFQVAPAELEQLLLSHPEIADAAVVPYPDEEAGEVPMAFVVRQLQSRSRLINEAEIMNFVAKQVAPYKKIRRVEFVNSIPKSPAGKILRKDLIKIAVPSRL